MRFSWLVETGLLVSCEVVCIGVKCLVLKKQALSDTSDTRIKRRSESPVESIASLLYST